MGPRNSKLSYIEANQVVLIWMQKHSNLYQQLSLNIIREICEYMVEDFCLPVVRNFSVTAFDFRAKQWRPWMSLSKEVFVDHHSCQVLFRHNYIFVCGGYDGGELKSVYVIRLSGEVTVKSNMKEARMGPGLIFYKESFYVFGGYARHRYLASCEFFRLEFSTWANLPEMQDCRSYFNHCISNNIIWLCGGESARSVETFNVETRLFARAAFSLPESVWCTAVVADNRVIVISSSFISWWTIGETEYHIEKHSKYYAWSNSNPAVKEGMVCIGSQLDHCARIVSLSTGEVTAEVELLMTKQSHKK